MSVKTIQNYQYRENYKLDHAAHFEVTTINLDISCVANENEVSEYYKIYLD